MQPQRRARLPRQRIDHRLLVTRAQIRQPLLHLRGRHLLDQIPQTRLQAGKTEIQLVAAANPARKIERVRPPARRELFDRRSARITEAQQLGPLVECLARRIIPGRGEHRHAPRLVEREQQRVAPRHNQSQVRQHRGQPRPERRRRLRMQRDKRRPDVSTKMIHAQHRRTQRQRQRLGRRDTDGETGGEARSIRHGNPGHAGESHLGARAREQRSEVAQMLTRRQIGHHAAVFLVERYLAVHPLAHQPALRIKQGDRRLVARTLERENHAAAPSPATRGSRRFSLCVRIDFIGLSATWRVGRGGARRAGRRAPPATGGPQWVQTQSAP